MTSNFSSSMKPISLSALCLQCSGDAVEVLDVADCELHFTTGRICYSQSSIYTLSISYSKYTSMHNVVV